MGVDRNGAQQAEFGGRRVGAVQFRQEGVDGGGGGRGGGEGEGGERCDERGQRREGTAR